MTKLDLLLSKLDGVRRAGDGRWRARCPSCGGKNATKLSIKDCGDGRLLLHDFGGCGVEAVLRAVGMDIADLMPERPASILDDQRQTRERKPWTARDVASALGEELLVAWVLLTDLANHKPITAGDRRRAKLAADRCASMVSELR